MLPRDSRIAVAAASAVYRGILGKIAGVNYDVFRHRAHLSAPRNCVSCLLYG